MNNIVVLVANQRTGSTALQSVLNKSDNIDVYGEVFHPMGKNTKCNFYQKFDHSKYDLPIKSNEDSLTMINDYLDFCVDSSSKKYCLLDIKYDFWHTFNGPTSDRFGKPALLSELEKRGAYFIHLTRNNLFEQFLSGAFAAHSKKWHFRDGESINVKEFEINSSWCLARLNSMKLNRDLFSNYLPNKKTVHLEYENLFVNGDISESHLNTISEKIGLKWNKLPKSGIRKTPVSIPGLVKNKRNLIEALEGTEFLSMAKDTLFPNT